jgi:hypothetical protein
MWLVEREGRLGSRIEEGKMGNSTRWKEICTRETLQSAPRVSGEGHGMYNMGCTVYKHNWLLVS